MFAKRSFSFRNTILGGLAASIIALGGLGLAQYHSSGIAAPVTKDNVSAPLPQAESTPASQTAPVPDELVYGIFFRQIAAFNAKADEMEKNGGDGTSLRRHFARIAALNDAESEVLNTIVADYIREEGLITARQKAVVDAYRIQYPGGQIQAGQPRERPPSFHEFTLEREQLYLRMRDQLQAVLGPQTFARLDSILRSKITGNSQSLLRATPLSGGQQTVEVKP